jgi:hypothetical protein
MMSEYRPIRLYIMYSLGFDHKWSIAFQGVFAEISREIRAVLFP